tara:strand:+ start:78807 stop:83132 length:4326 start_codon:yes stop_codon:yes gene_type:complete
LKKNITRLLFFILLTTGVFFVLINSEFFQKKIIELIINRFPNADNYKFSIDKTKIGFDGNLILNKVTINDTLNNNVEINELTMSLSELSDVFRNEYNFKEINLNGLDFNYSVDSFDINSNENLYDKNLSFSIKEKIRNILSEEIKSSINVEKININELKFNLKDLSKKKIDSFLIDKLYVSDFLIDDKSLSYDINNFNLRYFDNEIKNASGKWILKEDNLELKNFVFYFDDSKIKFDLKISNDKWIQSNSLDSLSLSLNLHLEDFKLKKFFSNQIFKENKYNFSFNLNGQISELEGYININLENVIDLSSGILINNLNTTLENTILDLDIKKLNLFNDSFKYIFSDNLYSKYKKYLNELNYINSNGKIRINSSTIESNYSIQSNIGYIESESTFSKNKANWVFENKVLFEDLMIGNFDLFKQINSVGGNLQLSGLFRENKIIIDSLNSQFKEIKFNNSIISNLNFDASVNNNIIYTKFFSDSKDFNISGNIDFDSTNYKVESIQFDLNRINLSKLKIASQESEVAFSAALKSIKNPENDNIKINIYKPNLIVDKKNNFFDDILIKYEVVNNFKSINIAETDALSFDLEGNFNFNRIENIVVNLLEEYYPFLNYNLRNENENIKFNLNIKNKFVSKIFPEIQTSDKTFIKADISNQNSLLEVNLPILIFGKNKFESINFSAINNINNETKLQTGKITLNEMKLKELKLVSMKKSDSLTFDFKASFDNKNETKINSNFSHYIDKDDNYSIKINTLEINDLSKWMIENNNENIITIDKKDSSIILTNFSFNSLNQKISFDGKYLNNDNLSFDLKFDEVKLNEIIPRNDKFVFEGNSNLDLKIKNLNGENFSKANFSVTEFKINDKYYGNLSFDLSSINKNQFLVDYKIFSSNDIFLKSKGLISVKENNLFSDMSLNFKKFDLSFLSKLGKDRVKEVEGHVSGIVKLSGFLNEISANGNLLLEGGSILLPFTNVRYKFNPLTNVNLYKNTFDFENVNFNEDTVKTSGILNGYINHENFKNWSLNFQIDSNNLLIFNKIEENESLFYGKGLLNGKVLMSGLFKNLTIKLLGSTADGTSIIIPWSDPKGLLDTSYIDFLSSKQNYNIEIPNLSNADQYFNNLELIIDLKVNNNAELEIVVDKNTGSTLKGRGAGDILMETNNSGKFNMWGNFIMSQGEYNFKNLGFIDKKFNLKEGGKISWNGNPVNAKMNLEAVYQVPGGANPAILVDNPNFNKKIDTNVEIKLQGDLLKPDDPDFSILFPNTSENFLSEINYRIADKQIRQLQAISLLSQGIFISDVSISSEGIANNLYQKASGILNSLLSSDQNKLNVGLNYLKGDKNPENYIRTEDRIGLTLTTQISDKILINGKIGVPVDGLEETSIVGDVQIDFILNEEGSLKGKVFNKENEFNYIGDETGYTQGIGISYDVNFNNFKSLLKKISAKKNKN